MNENIDNEIFVKIRFLYPSLTKSEKKAAELALKDYDRIINYTLSEYAEAAQCSDASILRFCRKLGLGGLKELKRQLASVNDTAYDNGTNKIRKEDDAYNIFKKIIWQYEKTLNDTLVLCNEDFDRAIQAVTDARKIVFFGVGDAGVVCNAAFIKFQRIGLDAAFYSDIAQSLACASQMKEGDLAVGISFSGETRLVVDSLRIAKENGATTLCIVHCSNCQLVKYSDIKIFTATTDFTPGHDEIARRTAEFAIIDTLYMGLVSRNPEKFDAKRQETIQVIINNKN